jgi:Ni/Co efflux regulator RcnB
MKRLLLTAAAGLMIAGSASLPAFAQQGRGGYESRQDDRGDRNGNADRNDRRRGDTDNRDRNRGERRQVSQHHDSNSNWRDTRRDARWNDRDHNGYYVGRTWHGGQPSARDYSRRDFSLGYRPWQRGDRLGSYNQRYREVAYRDYRVQRPPRGYHWVENDNGDLILAALVGGLIATIISNN